MDEKSYPYSPGHQNNETSIEAAELIKAGADTIRAKVYDVIVNKGNFGATSDEVAELLALLHDKQPLETPLITFLSIFTKTLVNGFKIDEYPLKSVDRLFGGKSTFLLSSWTKGYLKWFFYGIKKINYFNRKQKKIYISTSERTFSLFAYERSG